MTFRAAALATPAAASTAAPNPTVIATVPVGASPINSVLSADGRRLYVVNYQDETVSVIDTTTNKAVGAPIPVGDTPLAMAITPDGRKLYVANFYGSTLSAIDTSTGTTVPISVTNPDTIAITPDGSRVYVTSADRTVSAIDVSTGTLFPVGTLQSRATGSTISPDGRYVYLLNPYVSNTSGQLPLGGVTIIDTRDNSISSDPIPVGFSPTDMALSPDGKYLYVSNYYPADVTTADFTSGNDRPPGTVSVIDTQTRDVVATIPVGYSPGDIVVSPDGSRVYVGNAQTDGSLPGTKPPVGNISVIDTTTMTTVGDPIDVRYTGGVGALGASTFAISPDGSRLYVPDNHLDTFDPTSGQLPRGEVNVVDTATGTVVGTPLQVGVLPSTVIASRDGSRVYVVDTAGDGTAPADSSQAHGVVTIIATGTSVPVTPPPPVNPLGSLFDLVSAGVGQALLQLSQVFQGSGQVLGTTLSQTAALLTTVAGTNAALANTLVQNVSTAVSTGAADTALALQQFHEVLDGLSQVTNFLGASAAANTVAAISAFTYGAAADIPGVVSSITESIGGALATRGAQTLNAPLFLFGQAVEIYSYAYNEAAHTDFSYFPQTVAYAVQNPGVVFEETAKATVKVGTQVVSNVVGALGGIFHIFG